MKERVWGIARVAWIWVKRNRFAVTLAVFLLVLGVSAYTARNRITPTLPPQPTQPPVAVGKPMDERLTDVASPLAWPVAGREVLAPHSPEQAIWSDTLSLWQTHVGVDIKATKGEVVRAAAAGMVTKAERDALMGYLVEIQHEDGLTTRYANLSTDRVVKAGDRVKQGDTIGAVGESATAESSLSAHLHFEAWHDGQWEPLPTR